VCRDLSICSVSFNHRAHLVLNHEWTEHLNPGRAMRFWLVAENTPAGLPRLSRRDAGFAVREGAPRVHLPNYQHTIALNALLAEVSTRFLLVLDPDFFIVLPDWQAAVLDHMTRNGLAFFGVPWHPAHGDKYRYFPCVHCLFIDLHRVPRSALDFRPTWPDAPGLDHDWPHDMRALLPPLERLWHGAADRAGMRTRRANYCDSGTRLYWRFRNSRHHRHEVVQAVQRTFDRARLASRLVEWFLPDQYRYRPRKTGHIARRGLREEGLLDGAPAHWEEFMWDGRPFGFHVRRNFRKDEREEASELQWLERHLRSTATSSRGGDRARRTPIRALPQAQDG
jgi:hypothetical protein